ncbi:hypothetical protein EV385_4989 [Krasilnikovia cinnamomea]|uniref:Lipoprotein n=1 Tax=Krasilnikovia cinnamomea TaxID=349313 RepID=A0A4Q7ZQP5_9ACTN|nr:DUF6174 domain-containing protein [Krasilnikovia cinnamomea]RZU53104.1 hypothetical protein EV385_4989 [Krasilnikovia cinnamomea]
MRLKVTLCGLAVVVALGACTSSPPKHPTFAGGSSAPTTAGSPPPWQEPAAYGFVVERRCAQGPSLGRYRVAVQDGQVVRTERIDGRTAAGEEEIEVPSLGELLTLAQTAADDGGAVTTTFDPADGHPTAVSFSVSGQQDADGSCFLVSEYAPAS